MEGFRVEEQIDKSYQYGSKKKQNLYHNLQLIVESMIILEIA